MHAKSKAEDVFVSLRIVAVGFLSFLTRWPLVCLATYLEA